MKTLPKDIVFFSTADWDNPFWTNKQHIAVRLAERGFCILYVESLGLRRPTAGGKDMARIFRRLKKGMDGLRKVQENIWVYSPLVIPIHGNPWVRRFNRIILSTHLHRYIRRLGFKNPIFWIYNPLTMDLAGLFDASMLVYHCVDDLTASPGMPVDAIAATEKVLVRRADLILTASPKLQATRSKWNPNHTYYFPNVADFDHFVKAREIGTLPGDLAEIPQPRIGFVGAISDYKVDFELIAHVAGARKDWQWVLIGQVGEGQPETAIDLLKRPNIHLLGPKPYDTLPDYLRGFDVAVLPIRLNDYTAAMFPMKFFEYLAAGKPVVTTNLPALRDYADACILTDTPDDFIQAIDNVLIGKVPDRKRCLELAQEHTWERNLDRMENLLMKRWEQKYGS